MKMTVKDIVAIISRDYGYSMETGNYIVESVYRAAGIGILRNVAYYFEPSKQNKFDEHIPEQAQQEYKYNFETLLAAIYHTLKLMKLTASQRV